MKWEWVHLTTTEITKQVRTVFRFLANVATVFITKQSQPYMKSGTSQASQMAFCKGQEKNTSSIQIQKLQPPPKNNNNNRQSSDNAVG